MDEKSGLNAGRHRRTSLAKNPGAFSVRGPDRSGALYRKPGSAGVVRSAHIQREAVAAIRKGGGYVGYGWNVKNGNPIAGGRTLGAPKWLTDLIGVDYFGHVVQVSLPYDSTATDAAMAQVGRLTRLESLYLDDSSLGDAGLAHVKNLVGLSVLSLGNTDVTDTGLANLNGLINLSELQLGGNSSHRPRVGAQLKGLKNLSELDLSETQVSGDGSRKSARADRESSPLWFLSSTSLNDAWLCEHLKATDQTLLLGPRAHTGLRRPGSHTCVGCLTFPC